MPDHLSAARETLEIIDQAPKEDRPHLLATMLKGVYDAGVRDAVSAVKKAAPRR
jgi:hypothetical protein